MKFGFKRFLKKVIFILYPIYRANCTWKRCCDYFASHDIKKKLKYCGESVHIGKNCEITASHVSIGSGTAIGDNCQLIASISQIYIGNKCMFGPNVIVRGGNHRIDLVGQYMIDITENKKIDDNDKDVVIEDDVWIGTNAIILSGCHIGRGSVIGAGSVVTKDVPAYTVHIGTHNTFEKKRFNLEEIRKHEELLCIKADKEID